MKQKFKLMLGDNIESLKKIPDNSIDSVVTDPPYGLSFMNKKWDYDVPSVDFWKEVYRVLKPGGHIVSFGGTRTYHRMVVNIEDAGFEIRDQIMWLYGSGFPKSHNIGKAVDKLEGNEREVIGDKPYKSGNLKIESILGGDYSVSNRVQLKETKGNSPYEGWGTALKPANEPICLARKPLSEKSVAENVLKWKTGGINVDGCRIGSDTIKSVYGGFTNALIDGRDENTRKEWIENSKKENGQFNTSENEGRFPANIILECICDEVIKGEKGEPRISNKKGGSPIFGSELSVDYKGTWPNDKGDIHTNPMCPCRLLDEQSGVSKSNTKQRIVEGKDAGQMYHRHEQSSNNYKNKQYVGDYSDKGGASRFFYQAKVSKAERNMGLDHFEDKETKGSIGLHSVGGSPTKDNNRIQKNTHPTVKPINLMTYLCRLITPEGGIVLDPFMGSGSTGIAAQLEGFRFVGMEMDEEYIKIATTRIENYEKYKKFIK